MIEVPEGQDRGKFLFSKYPGVITKKCNENVEAYYGSAKDYLSLKRRVSSFDDLYDLRFKGNEAFISEIAVPVSRKIMLETKAYIRKYFENDPLFTLFARFETPPENAEVAQKVLNYNMTATHYRRDCMLWQIDCAAKYGVFVTFAQYVEGFGQRGNQTIYDPNTAGGYGSQRVQPTRKNIVNYPVHPLNYFQDITAQFSYEPAFKGFIDRWTLAHLYQLLKNKDERYDQEILGAVVAKGKNGIKDQHYYGADGTYYAVEKMDLSSRDVHVRRIWTKLPFEDNEDDDTTYYVEMVDNKIIRIEENKYDKDMCPLSVGNMLPRINTWWGNAGHESKIAHQNLMNWLINAQVESTMKSMDRLVFIRKGGGVNWNAVNNRHRMGGVVPVEGMEPLQNQVFPVQFQDASIKGVDWLMRELKEEVQAENPVTNLQAQYNQGGLNNKTLGAAQMIASIGEILQSDVMTNFSYGQQRIAEANVTGLQQLLEDQFYVKANPKANPEQVDKYKILGDFDYVVETSVKLNEFGMFSQRSNLLTQLLNWKAAGVAELNNVNWGAILKDIIKNGVGNNVDLANYYKDQPVQPMQQPQNPMMPGPGGGAPPAGPMPGAPMPAPGPAPAPAQPTGVPNA